MMRRQISRSGFMCSKCGFRFDYCSRPAHVMYLVTAIPMPSDPDRDGESKEEVYCRECLLKELVNNYERG